MTMSDINKDKPFKILLVISVAMVLCIIILQFMELAQYF